MIYQSQMSKWNEIKWMIRAYPTRVAWILDHFYLTKIRGIKQPCQHRIALEDCTICPHIPGLGQL